MEAAGRWQEERHAGLGEDFLDEYEGRWRRIVGAPQRRRRIRGANRKLNFHRFPCGIVYSARGDGLDIKASPPPCLDAPRAKVNHWADVWKKDCLGWEYKGRHKDLGAAYDPLLESRADLNNRPVPMVCGGGDNLCWHGPTDVVNYKHFHHSYSVLGV